MDLNVDVPSGSSLEPNLNFVAIWVGDVSVGEAGSELAATEQASSGPFDLSDGTVDIAGVHETETEMCDAPAETGGGGVLGEGDDVVPCQKLEYGRVHLRARTRADQKPVRRTAARVPDRGRLD